MGLLPPYEGPISLEAIDVLRTLAHHQREIDKHMRAIEDLALDLEAVGSNAMRELRISDLVRDIWEFTWSGDSALTVLSPEGRRTAATAESVLGRWK